MFSISVCMIVKDEEIIIVDTGSQDNSIKIAQNYTNNIFHFEWCQDFSKARNFSFSKATKDYIMWLDADDYITPKNIAKILSLKKLDTNVDVYMFKYVMGFIDNTPTFEFYRERLLKRSMNFHWQGFVHETITPRGVIKQVDIEIEHRKIKANPTKRNLKLYNYALKQGIKLNLREQYYYSRELYFNHHFKKSIHELKKYLKMQDSYLPNVIGAYQLLCESYLQINNPSIALKFGLKAISLFTPNSEFCCLLAKIYESNRQINQSIFWYNTALIAPKYKEGFIQKDYQDFIPYLELSRIYYQIDYNNSKHFHILAKKIHPNHISIKFNEKFFN